MAAVSPLIMQEQAFVGSLPGLSGEDRTASLARRQSSRPVWYSIGDLAREFDVTLRTLRFYEAKGLLNPIRQHSVRVYGPRDRVKLQLILVGKRLGFTLQEIAAMIAESDDGTLASLKLDPDMILRQITFLEDQQRTTELALGELRRRYYLMVEIDETEQSAGT